MGRVVMAVRHWFRRHTPSLVAATLVVAGAGVGLAHVTGNALWSPSGGLAAPASPLTLPAVQDAEELPAGTWFVGGLPTRLAIPTAGIDAAVSEVGIVQRDGRAEWETAWRSAGHHLDSARPGQPGNAIFSGHVSVADPSNVPVFAALDSVRPGDVIEVWSGEQRYSYVVESVQVVAPTHLKILRSDHRSTITLITCTRDLKNRLVVSGKLL
jgi:LPXTG-site transpeptidase (sortase) family protein